MSSLKPLASPLPPSLVPQRTPLLARLVSLGDAKVFRRALREIQNRCPNRKATSAQINARDPLIGATALHVAASIPSSNALEMGRLLLETSVISVNIQDTESGWTPLHRALYHGNWSFALLLLQHPSHPADTTIRDREGLSPFALLRTTLPGGEGEDTPLPRTLPLRGGEGRGSLYTWGTGANYSLGHGDASDRAHPERVKLPSPPSFSPLSPDLSHTLPIRIAMGSRHSALLTAAPADNLLTCGFGGGGRLGLGEEESRLTYSPVPGIQGRVIDVACGKDHTIALSDLGVVWTFGANAHGQLGRSPAVPPPPDTLAPDLIAPGPVLGALRRERLLGVTASATASVVWSASRVWGFGLHQGHLGHDAGPSDRIIHSPRELPLPPLHRPGDERPAHIAQCVLTERALALLTQHGEVFLLSKNTVRRMSPFRLSEGNHSKGTTSMFLPTAPIPVKLLSDPEGDTFAFLSSAGEVYTWQGDQPTSLRRIWTAHVGRDRAVDAAIGGGGRGSGGGVMIVICTRDGRVGMGRPRGQASGGAAPAKGKRYAWDWADSLPRGVSKVALGGGGSLGAIRVEGRVHDATPLVPPPSLAPPFPPPSRDVRVVLGADHTVGTIEVDILAARSPPIRLALTSIMEHLPKDGLIWASTGEGPCRISLSTLPSMVSPSGYTPSGFSPEPIPSHGYALRITGLAEAGAVEAAVAWLRGDEEMGDDESWVDEYLDVLRSLECPVSLGRRRPLHADLAPMLQSISASPSPLPGKVTLLLEGGEVRGGCHPSILSRASPFFASLLRHGAPWTGADPLQDISLPHIRAPVMDILLRWAYQCILSPSGMSERARTRVEEALFAEVALPTPEEVLDFLLECLLAADELLMPDLVFFLQQELILQVHPKNVMAIFDRVSLPALAFAGEEVRAACAEYILRDLEWYAHRGLYPLEGLHPILEEVMRHRQAELSPATRLFLRGSSSLRKTGAAETWVLEMRIEALIARILEGGASPSVRLDEADEDQPANPPTGDALLPEGPGENGNVISRGKSKFIPMDLSSTSPTEGPHHWAIPPSSITPIPIQGSTKSEKQQTTTTATTATTADAFPSLSLSSSPSATSGLLNPVVPPRKASTSSSAPSPAPPINKVSQKERKRQQQLLQKEGAKSEGRKEKVWAIPMTTPPPPKFPTSSPKRVTISLKEIKQEVRHDEGNRGRRRSEAPMPKPSPARSNPPTQRRNTGPRIQPPLTSWETSLSGPSSSRRRRGGGGPDTGASGTFGEIQAEQRREKEELREAVEGGKSLVDIQTEELVLQGWRDYYADLGVVGWEPPPGWKVL